MLRAGPSSLPGPGVFLEVDVPADALLERAPVLVIPAEDWDALCDTSLAGYVWGWGDDGDMAIALGHANLLNHSYEPNCRYEHDVVEGFVELYSLRPLRAGEELTINYNGDPGDGGDLWFDVSG